jgi:hypothetical protein
VETHTLTPIRSALIVVLKPLPADGTNNSFSAYSWAVRPPGQDVRKQARKTRVSRTPEINMGVLLGRSPAGKQSVCHLGANGGAIRHVAQTPGHVTRHAPVDCLR